MNKNLIKLVVLGLMISFALPVGAKGRLSLEAVEKCGIQYGGDSCVVGLEITNVGEELEGIATVHIDYSGVCSNNIQRFCDGEGVQIIYNEIESSGWDNGDIIFDSIIIPAGKTYTSLEIRTYQALCPGQYNFSFVLKADGEEADWTSQKRGYGGKSAEGSVWKLVETDTESGDTGFLEEIVRLLKLIVDAYKELIGLKKAILLLERS